MDANDIKNLGLPAFPGVYKFFGPTGRIIYIGKAADLKSRVASYWRQSAVHVPAKQEMMKEIFRIEWEETETEIEALLLEANLVKRHQPKYNIDLRDDKRFAYIKVSTEDEIPGVFITRRLDRSGRYFGPFVSAGAVRETIKAVRKIWPYCAERRIKAKPCFYYQIGRCAGPCGGKIGLAEYRQEVVGPIIAFLSGGKKKIIKGLEFRIKNLETKEKSAGLAEDEAAELARLKYRVLNMKQVLAHANILGVGDKYAADVFELAKVLSLPKAPERIEGYDISNIFGEEAVGSMVVFKNGEPDKSGYRKFKIKLGQGEANDVGMIREVLARRLRRSLPPGPLPAREETGGHGELGERWPLPDLMIIDGGKGQLNGAVMELKKAKLGIPVIAVSKGAGLRSAAAPDKIFFPGEKQPLVLPLASPALHIVKRVRDEAHRFALKYHRALRQKGLFKK